MIAPASSPSTAPSAATPYPALTLVEDTEPDAPPTFDGSTVDPGLAVHSDAILPGTPIAPPDAMSLQMSLAFTEMTVRLRMRARRWFG